MVRIPSCLEKSLSGGWNRTEPEPIPPCIDSWARGAIPSKPDPSTSDKHLSLSSPGNRDEHGEEQDRRQNGGENSSSTMQAVGNAADQERGKAKSSVDAAVLESSTRRTSDQNNDASRDDNDGDGRAWGVKDEDGEEIGPLSSLADGAEPGGEETLAGAGGIGDAIGRGRRQEERAFLEVKMSAASHSLLGGVEVNGMLGISSLPHDDTSVSGNRLVSSRAHV